MIRRTVANIKMYQHPSIDDLGQATFDFKQHFYRKATRLELSLDSLNRLFQDKHLAYGDPIELIQSILQLEIVIDQTLKDDEGRLVHEQRDNPTFEEAPEVSKHTESVANTKPVERKPKPPQQTQGRGK